jgi:hypothetical protein
MADKPTPAPAPDNAPEPAKAPTRVRLSTEDHLSRFVVPHFDGDNDLTVDHDGVPLPAKDADHLQGLAADYGIRLIITPEKD